VLSAHFYQNAVRIGNHAFIEFTGFMNEYIKLCEQSQKCGEDFTEANVHIGKPLTVFGYNAAYIGEKFGCIFESSFNQLENIGEFCQKAFGLVAELREEEGRKVLVLRKQ